MSFFACPCSPDKPHVCGMETRHLIEWDIHEQGLPTGRLSPREILHGRSLCDLLAGMDAIIHVAQQEDLHPLIKCFAKDHKTKGSATRASKRAHTVYNIVRKCEQKDDCINTLKKYFPVLSITSELSKLIHNTWECTHFDPSFEDFDDTWEGLFKNLEHIIKAFVNTHDGDWFFYKGHYEDPNRPY